MSKQNKKIDCISYKSHIENQNSKATFEKIFNTQKLINQHFRNANFFASKGDINQSMVYLSLVEQNLRLKVKLSLKLQSLCD